MRVGSLFAGIGGFDLGFERAGMTTAWQVEIDPKCRELLAARFPHARQFDDVTTCGAHNLEPVDVVCGGFPCQDLSVAGKRAGLAGARSGLFYEMVRIADELKAPWLVWENVPGLLSSHRGRDFAAVLVELERVGYRGCWTTLDARYFGVAQRRRRIFGVFARGDSGAERAAEVLALAARLRGNPAPRGAEGARASVASLCGIGSGGPDDNDCQANRIVTPALQAGSPTYERGDGSLFCVPTTCETLSPGAHPGSYNGQDAYTDHLIAHALDASDGIPRCDGCDNLIPIESLVHQGYDSTHANATQADPDQAMRVLQEGDGAPEGEGRRSGVAAPLRKASVLRPSLHGRSVRREADEAGRGLGDCPLPCETGMPARSVCEVREAGSGSASHQRRLARQSTGEPHPPVSEMPHRSPQAVGVRRLTPTECERLMGFPDGWTEGFSDTHRYRMLGNAVAVPCAAWIGRRLVTK